MMAEAINDNRVNSVEPFVPKSEWLENIYPIVFAKPKTIPSQAAPGNGSAEGVTTRRVSPNNNPAHERPTSNTDEEIV